MVKRPSINKLLLVAVASILAVGLGLFHNQTATAHTIEPFVKDYLLETNTSLEEAFLFTNTSDTDQFFLLTTGAYNPESEEFFEGTILAKPEKGRIEVAAGEQVQIDYTIDIPSSLDPGSYFNVIVVEEESPSTTSDNSVSLRPGYGIIIAMHIVEEGGSIKGAFTRLSETVINVVENGFPYLTNTKLEYQYRNGSQYVFAPIAEVRAYDLSTNERVYREDVNLMEKKVYPGGDFNKEFELDLWDYKNFTHDFEVVSRTYNQFDSTYIEKTVLIEAPPILQALGGILVAIVVVAIIIKRYRKSK